MACGADGLDTRWHIWHVGGIGDWSDCSAIDCGSGYTPSFRLENDEGVQQITEHPLHLSRSFYSTSYQIAGSAPISKRSSPPCITTL